MNRPSPEELKSIASDLRVEAAGKRDWVENMRDLVADKKRQWPADDLDRKWQRAAVLDRAAEIIEAAAGRA
jgi:hypothetical protein